jgi:FAD/FMN-containing dehydrogenase
MPDSISAALERIAAVVGPGGIVAPADAAALWRDERARYRGAAALVVRPASTEECAAVVRVCHEAPIGVVPQGGNTGYCGGGGILDGTLAESETQRRSLWLLRERMPEAERRDGGSVKHDVSVPIARIPEFIVRAELELARIAPHRLSIYGHNPGKLL